MQCPICKRDVAHFEAHHFWPREYGGTDFGTVDICSTCHAGLHLSANKRYKGIVGQDAFTSDVLLRAEPFIEIILEARRLHEANSSPTDSKKLIISLPAWKLAKLHKYKADKGFTSLEKLMNAVIDQLLIGR